jgi:hypothetical protein
MKCKGDENIGENKPVPSILSDHLRVDLVRIIEANRVAFSKVWKKGMDRGDAPYDVASKILTQYSDTDDICDKISVQGEVSEAKNFIIDYYTKGKGGEMSGQKTKLTKEDAKDLKSILDEDNFDEIWKKKIAAGNVPEDVANTILTGYNSTDLFLNELDPIFIPAARVFVINYFTKGEGPMGKIKDAIRETKEDNIKAGAIILKISSGDIAIKNIKKLIAGSIGMSDDHKEKFMDNPLVDVALAQFGAFLMSLPQNDGKMKESLKLVRECIILSSTQKAFNLLDVDKYVDKMIEGIDLPALKKLSKKNSIVEDKDL